MKNNNIAKNGELPSVLEQKIQKMKEAFPEHEEKFPYPDKLSIQRQMEYFLNQPKSFFLYDKKQNYIKKEIMY